ncbi:hypothetical protein ACWD6R_20340, partial [Streptomyces sp. NPDC005151]
GPRETPSSQVTRHFFVPRETVHRHQAGGSRLKQPAGLLAHRLATHLPPPLPAAPTPVAAPRPHPLQDCDGCDRPFRAPEPGRCHDCRTDVQEAA